MEIKEFDSSKMSMAFAKYLKRNGKTLMEFIHEIQGRIGAVNARTHATVNDDDVFDIVNELYMPHSECNSNDIYDVVFPGVCKEMKIVDSNPEETKRMKEKLKNYLYNPHYKEVHPKFIKREITINNEKYEHEISEEVMDVVNNEGKTLDYYVEKITNDVINNCIYDLDKIGDFYPKEFDYCFYYDTKRTFEPLIEERISSLNTFKAKVYKIARNYLEGIQEGAGAIEYLTADIQMGKDIDDAIDSIQEIMEQIGMQREIIEELSEILTDSSLDNSKMLRIHLHKKYIAEDEYYLTVDYDKDGEQYFFMLPRQLFTNYENKQSNDCWLELPENFKIDVYGKCKNRALSSLQLKDDLNKDLE